MGKYVITNDTQNYRKWLWFGILMWQHYTKIIYTQKQICFEELYFNSAGLKMGLGKDIYMYIYFKMKTYKHFFKIRTEQGCCNPLKMQIFGHVVKSIGYLKDSAVKTKCYREMIFRGQQIDENTFWNQ